jgi:hypothetical protein
MVEYRWISLASGMALTVGMIWYWSNFGMPVFGTRTHTLFSLGYGLVAWSWVQTALGFGFRYLNAGRAVPLYAGEAVLPFYILHQTVLLVVGYFVVRWAIPDIAKWAIIAVISFAAIMLIYEFLIRRWNVMRFLFGLKPLPRQSVAADRERAKPLRAPGAGR